MSHIKFMCLNKRVHFWPIVYIGLSQYMDQYYVFCCNARTNLYTEANLSIEEGDRIMKEIEKYNKGMFLHE